MIVAAVARIAANRPEANHLWMNPVLSYGMRRFQTAPVSLQLYQNGPPVERLFQSVSRLYARRVMDAAIATAASQTVVAQMEQAMEKPLDWNNWERKEWASELLETLGESKLQRLWSATSRLVSLGCLVAPMTILTPLSYVSDRVHKWTWQYALWGIEQAGPTFIKLTQWATTRHDLFSPEFCRYFGQLQDRTKGHSWEETRRILAEDLGVDADRIDLEQDPIGSGCVAQVYRGHLSEATGQYPKGTEVAVKVQHPGIWHKVCVDFYIMGKVAGWLESIPYLNLEYVAMSDSVRQFRDIMLPQLDLNLEAKHLNRFNRDFASDDTVSFPYPLQDLTSSRVLTETFVQGTPILDFINSSEAVRKEVAYLGLNTTLKMIFLNDFLHGMLIVHRVDGRCTVFSRAFAR